MIFQWDPDVPLVVDENIELPQLQLVKNYTADCTQVYSTGNFTCLEVVFVLKRRLGYYLFHTYVPTCLIVIMSWVSFWIKPEAAPARVTLGVTSLLTLSTQHAKSQASLPPVSYLKAVDAFMSVCTVFVFMALMEYCLVNIVLGDSDAPAAKPAPPPPPPSSSTADSAKLDKIFDIAAKVMREWRLDDRRALCLRWNLSDLRLNETLTLSRRIALLSQCLALLSGSCLRPLPPAVRSRSSLHKPKPLVSFSLSVPLPPVMILCTALTGTRHGDSGVGAESRPDPTSRGTHLRETGVTRRVREAAFFHYQPARLAFLRGCARTCRTEEIRRRSLSHVDNETTGLAAATRKERPWNSAEGGTPRSPVLQARSLDVSYRLRRSRLSWERRNTTSGLHAAGNAILACTLTQKLSNHRRWLSIVAKNSRRQRQKKRDGKMLHAHYGHVALAALIIILITLAGPASSEYGRDKLPSRGPHAKRPHPCEQSSCYPATGNLLIGRKDRLSASSTCGLTGPERFCIVSHLKDRKKCFFCDASIPKQQHNIENIVSGISYRSWWQAENGVENVTIRFDLEAEFHFTHIIIRFQTFRPAAMLIERSYDFGKTWQVYRYFAHNCEHYFPEIPTHQPQRLTDVICETRYSAVAPSTGGDVIFRVLPRNLEIDNPYSKEVQNLLKITNLRINMTRLHTLGDDLLDDRPEIREKYYYAIQDMVIRGSCSCYGHASRCLPLPGVSDEENMVHGRCECTHNTKGLNCDKCEDFYNDLPWKPAVGKQTNACRPCNCNNHTNSCHFDETVYERSGRVSGGVCDDCQHNTRGQNCEQCKPFYYHDVTKDISDRDACQPCDCDLSGSLDDGICDSRTDPLSGDESGRCHCKTNVDGRRCDRCKNGFWNFEPNNPEGCQACTCNTLGTIDNQGCNVVTGECTCKRYVTARDCNQCVPEYWGLSEDRDGCKPCDCDPGGSYEHSCDVITGQCRCRPHVSGRTCNQPEQSYYTGSLDFLIYEGELSRATDNCQVVIREPYRDGRNSTWTGTGFMKAIEGAVLNFTIDDIRRSMWYDVIVRYEPVHPGVWEDVQIILERDSLPDPNGPCADWRPEYDRLWVQLPLRSRSAMAQPSICLEAGKHYNLLLQFRKFNGHVDTPSASILVDSIVLQPRIDVIPFFKTPGLGELRRQEYERYHCNELFNDVNSVWSNVPEICRKYQNSIGYYVFDGAHSCECNPTGSRSLLCENYGGMCPCKPNVVGRRCDRCAPGTYGFGPEGCIPCDCDGVGALDNFCDVETGRCKCRPNTYGRTCGQCEPGFWNFPHCQRCECHGHADSCDSKTGACINCRDFTTGHNCDRCVDDFYGDPRIGVDIPCRACPCPGTRESGHSYANSCSLDSVTQDVVCECFEGYAGPRCEHCAENYFGNPEVPLGSCQLCNCNNNTDLRRPGNCDPHTGHCLQCLFNTDGATCEVCKAGFYGDALRQDCQDCGCNVLGTDKAAGPCNHRNGQCPCLPHVIGQLCDSCEENHWKIASGQGCDPCECDAVGSISDRCNPYDGTCECRPGFGGRRCNECQTNFWGNPNVECYPCECDVIGSASQQCDRETGVCVCHKGIGGEKCDQCDRGYHGEAPQCSPCGECFDNWDLILDGLRNKTNAVIQEASRIQKVGTTGVYSQEFDDMKESLNEVRDLISNTTIRSQDLDALDDLASELEKNISKSAKELEESNIHLENLSQRVNLGDVALKKLRNRTNSLHEAAADLRENATRLQEENVLGALNVTQQMAEQSRQAERMANDTTNVLSDAERFRKHTENLLAKNRASVNEAQERNKESLMKLNEKLKTFGMAIPELNLQMCGDNVTDCSTVCGGAGCGFCGGLSCHVGAVSKANQALDVAKQQAAKIKSHKDEAEQLLRNMSQIKQDATAARSNAQDAFNYAWEARNRSDKITKDLSDITKRIWSTLDEDQPTPAMVRDLAYEVLAKNIQLEPDEITRLADRIKSIVGSLTDSEKILADTKNDLQVVHTLEALANRTKETAIEKQTLANKVILLLNDAQKAQHLAQDAIDKAEADVSKSHNDLADIADVTKAAQIRANSTTQTVEALDARLKQLQTQSAKNGFILAEIGTEAKKVTDEAQVIDGKTKKLSEEYKRADESLNHRVNKSKGDIQRAKRLLQRASELTADTSTKSKDLDGMESVYKDNERLLTDLMSDVDALTMEMERHLGEIEKKSQLYRQCSA